VAESAEVKKRRERETEKEDEGGTKDTIKSQEKVTEEPLKHLRYIEPWERKAQELMLEELSWIRDVQIAFREPLTLSYKQLDGKLPYVAVPITPYFHISTPSIIASQPYDIVAKKVDSETKGITIIAEIYDALREVPSIEFKKSKEVISITADTDLAPPPGDGSLTDLVRYIPGLIMFPFRKAPEVGDSLRLDFSVTARKIGVIEKLRGVPEPEEVPTILDMVFDIDEETRKSLIHTLYDRPRLIIACKPPSADLSYIELIKRLLREIYRVCVGGLPKPRHISKGLSEVDLDIKADRSVYVLISDSIQAEIGKLGDRLKELFSQRYGFLVLYGMDEKFSVELREEPYPLPVTLRLAERSKDQFMKAVKAFYGFVEESPFKPDNLDVYTVLLEELFYDKIRKLLSDVRRVLAVEPSSEDEEGIGGESTTHFALKVFCKEYFVEKEGVETVETEVDIPTAGRVDLLVKGFQSSNLAVEIETLYGTGLPVVKLKKTIESRLRAGLDLWLVAPPMQAFIYLKELLYLRKLFRDSYGERLEIYTINLTSNSLITLSDFVGQLLS
jgi:hypothetical protein